MNEHEHLADTIRRSQEGPAWHGPSLSEILQGVTAEHASKRVGDAHTIWELTEHIIAWLDIVRRRIESERLTDDNLTSKDNWPPVPEATEENWHKTVSRAAEANHRLCQRVISFGIESALDKTVPGRDYTYAVMLNGAAQHVIYHAGQIALLKKLMGV
jgi:uncharacterized damage-inducible protein DinB